MGNHPETVDCDTPGSGRIVRIEEEPATGDHPIPGQRLSSAGHLAAFFADELKNPLAVVIANLQLLADLVASVNSELARESGTRPDLGPWLTLRMAEADACLGDARVSAERIRDAVVPKKPPQPRASDRAPPPFEQTLRPARILIVDDEEKLARAMQRLFRDHNVVVNLSSQGALDRIVRGERFDLILSDVGMPQMSGCSLYEEIRRVAPDQASIVVFVTGGSADERTEKALAATGQPVLMKPFDPMELRAFVERFLR
jgi:CheY-like chemotaxis protein